MGKQHNRGNYTYFRWARRPRLICAVGSDQPLPHFVRSGTWVQFERSSGDGDWPPGFDPGAAEFACSFQGFYLSSLSARTTPGAASPAPSTTCSA